MNYLSKIYPGVFGDDFEVLCMDTDSVYGSINTDHEKYKNILEETNQYFGKEIGLMEPEMINNTGEQKNCCLRFYS